jgi:hypothetical protein
MDNFSKGMNIGTNFVRVWVAEPDDACAQPRIYLSITNNDSTLWTTTMLRLPTEQDVSKLADALNAALAFVYPKEF